MPKSYKNIFSKLSANLIEKIKKIPEPSFLDPMLATLTKNYFSSKEWLYEEKFDGERCLVFKKNGVVNLLSRNNKNMNNIYPDLLDTLKKQSADNFIIDGEIITLNKHGVSDFELLQSRMNLRVNLHKLSEQKDITIIYRIFDLMYIDGYDIRKLPLYARKEILKNLLKYNKILVYTEHKLEHGLSYFKEACKLHWEGIIAKRINGEYVGVRSRDWLKFKCIMKQELVIAGYTDPKGSRSYFGALLVGYYEKNKLIYAGKVGTGYSEEILAMLGKKLEKIKIKTCPFSEFTEDNRLLKNINWVKPIIVAEFEFAQWTNAGKLRVGRYKGLRDDKEAKDVVKEIPKNIEPDSV